MPTATNPKPITQTPPELVSPRFLAAEAAASAALALVQTPAVWSCLHTMALLLEAHQEPSMSSNRMAALAELIEESMIKQPEMTTALDMLDCLDQNARRWSRHAHPLARPGVARVQVIGTVS